ncbi:MAG: T9SS type A sorting domain-containing protein [Fimbriimonadaceae bacterium]|nr:T9SS type A sorting domain-containing protein [Chitinophagales bacterium]
MDNAIAENIKTWPNPFSTTIQIEYTTGNENFLLMNVAGKIIWSGKDIAQKDLFFLAPGIYILKMQDEQKIHITHVIKQ